MVWRSFSRGNFHVSIYIYIYDFQTNLYIRIKKFRKKKNNKETNRRRDPRSWRNSITPPSRQYYYCRFPRLSHWLRHLFCTFVFVNGSCRYNIFFWLSKLILNTWIICVCCKSVELYKSSLWVDVWPNVRRPLRSSTCIYMFIDFTSISASIRVWIIRSSDFSKSF